MSSAFAILYRESALEFLFQLFFGFAYYPEICYFLN